MAQANFVKKISPKQVSGDIKKFVREASTKDGLLAHDGDQVSFYRVFGIADGILTGETDFGPWVAFTGQHEAINVNGEVFKSNKTFLPAPIDGMIQAALGDNDSVEYALEVFVKRRDDLAIGYEYIPRPLIEAQENDPLAHLRQTTLAIGHETPDTTESPVKPKTKK